MIEPVALKDFLLISGSALVSWSLASAMQEAMRLPSPDPID